VEISKSARDRIFAAADFLYAESERKSFPTVDAVRKRALVNMNDASSVMKEWRRAQTTTFQQVANQIPIELNTSCTTALASLWSEATAMANESLRAAQAGWDVERRETEDLSRQLAVAYDLQATELADAQSRIVQLQAQFDAMNSEMTAIRQAVEASERDRLAAINIAREAEVKALEIGRRTNDLRSELDHARDELVRERAEITAGRISHNDEIQHLRDQAKRDLAYEREKVEREKERMQLVLGLAKEEAAELRGRLAATRPASASLKRTKAPDGEARKNGSG
jgi:colicin import membrane protein